MKFVVPSSGSMIQIYFESLNNFLDRFFVDSSAMIECVGYLDLISFIINFSLALSMRVTRLFIPFFSILNPFSDSLMINFPAFLAIFFAWSRIFIKCSYYTASEMFFLFSAIHFARLTCTPSCIASQTSKTSRQQYKSFIKF